MAGQQQAVEVTGVSTALNSMARAARPNSILFEQMNVNGAGINFYVLTLLLQEKRVFSYYIYTHPLFCTRFCAPYDEIPALR